MISFFGEYRRYSNQNWQWRGYFTHMTNTKLKKIILTAAVVLILSAAVFCLIPRTTVWNEKIRCYNLNGIDMSLSDDTKIDGITDYIDIQCDFSVSGPLFPSSLRGAGGTVSFNGSEYRVTSRNADAGKNLLAMSLSGEEFEMNMQLYLSRSEKYIMLFNPMERSEEEGGSAVYWIGSCEDIDDLKTALNDFDWVV